jgi:hypothetical protein
MPDFLTFFATAIDSDSDSAALVPLALCLSGFIFYLITYLRYRNTDKRHHHEKETTATVQKLQRYDQLVEHRTRLRNASMSGANDSTVEGSLSQGGLSLDMGDLGNVVGKLLK